MPWSTPTLKDVRTQVRDGIQGSLTGSDANVPNSVLRVFSDVMGALCHLVLQYLDWLALQLMPDTAETEWLDRHGDIWLVNADGSTGRKMASLAAGQANFTATGANVTVPTATQLIYSGTQIGYETTADIVAGSTPTPAPIQAIDPGSAGNLDVGTRLVLVTAVPGIDPGSVTVVSLTGGTDEETDDELRARILDRIRNPPMGGDAHDYVQWALGVSGVTRAWSAANEMGVGTVTVRFLMDDLRSSNDGWPTPDDVIAVADVIDQKRPVAVKDCFVVAPIKQFVDVTIANLVPNTSEVQSEIESSIRSLIKDRAAPGQTIFAAWISYAIMSTSVQSFFLVSDSDYVMESPGNMAVIGTISYE